MPKTEKTKRASSMVPGPSESLPAYTYVKALPLREPSDVDVIKNEVRSGNIVIVRITPLAKRSVGDVKRAVNELCEFVGTLKGDIARLGEERVVITPPSIKIWRGERESPASDPAED